MTGFSVWNERLLTSPFPDREWRLFMLFWAICISGGIYFDQILLYALPALLLGAYFFVKDVKPFYYLLLATLPISIEYSFSDALGTDLPSEPLMLMLTGAFLLFAIRESRSIRFNHLFDLLLLVNFCWIITTIFFAEITLISIKYALAKFWYIITFYALARRFLKTPEDWKKAIWLLLIPLTITHIITLVKFQSYGFAFADVNRVVGPFYRNHVNFAALAVVVLPYGWHLFNQYPTKNKLKWVVGLCLLILLIGVQFSYTRAAYGALLAGIGMVYLVRWKLVKVTIATALIAVTLFVASLLPQNRFMDIAPDYENTITHFEFSDLINATYKLQDISTMERVYRWVAAFYMIGERPYVGFGPNNFYDHYKNYTVHAFQTYVSGNPERSGIHSYYLMVAVEQGIPGLVIYMILIIVVMLYGERLYHRTVDPIRKSLVVTALSSLVVIHTLQTMNDLIETDKVGPFFFLSMAVLVVVDRLNRTSPTQEIKPFIPGN